MAMEESKTKKRYEMDIEPHGQKEHETHVLLQTEQKVSNL